MYYDILDKKRQEMLPALRVFKDRFYLAGGTALALHMGHRDSVDFDFFTEHAFDTATLFEEIIGVFGAHAVRKIQDEKNTLTVLAHDSVKISFFTYPYALLSAPPEEPNVRLASIEDIACMKLAAITSRATNKDYIDLYFIFHTVTLQNILRAMEKKLPMLDVNLVLKSLVYFEDIVEEPILYTQGNEVAFAEVKRYLTEEVKKFALPGSNETCHV